jgi:hypothetical protein
MSTELHIFPDGARANEAIITVADMLVAGDEIDVHIEASPPWLRVSVAAPTAVIAKMRAMGVRVEVQR